jgi:hypothetical protein
MYLPEALSIYKNEIQNKVYTLEFLEILKKATSKLDINLVKHVLNLMEDDNQFKYVRRDFAELFGSHYISVSKKLKKFGRNSNFILSSYYMGKGGTDRKFMVNPYAVRTKNSQIIKENVEFWDTLIKIKGIQHETEYFDENYF